jgi:hypothetical protein
MQAAGQMIWGPGQQFRSAAMGAGHAGISSQWAESFGESQADLNSGQASNNISGFAASSAREAYGIGEKRFGTAAEFGGQLSTYNASVGLSDHAAGYIGSLGGDASVVSPTSKPTDMTGMAMSGRLGMAAQQSSNWAMGGFHGVQQAAVGKLNSNYGSSYVQSAWTTPMSMKDYGKINSEVNKIGSRILDDYARDKE